MSTLEHYVEIQAHENTYDLEANLALLKLYQFNPGTYKTEIACLILLKALTNLPHTDFVLCKCLLLHEQVHFREPGLTHKANIATESKAAIAGGITSFIEMPNTIPQATTIDKLEEKFQIAAKTSYANYSFMFGGTNDNLEEILKVDTKNVAALKLFLGSSTGNMLVDNHFYRRTFSYF